MAPTYWSQMQNDRLTSWRLIRQSRAKPPRDKRDAQLFGSSLEQAQELFEAAAGLSTATRALPLFYGLSQAGRAIAVQREPGVRLRGHGLKTDLDHLHPDPLGRFLSMTVRSDGPDTASFNTLSRLLASAPARHAQPMGHLLGMVIETTIHDPKFPSRNPAILVGGPRNGEVSVPGIPVAGDRFEPGDLAALAATYPGVRNAVVSRTQPLQSGPDGRHCSVELAAETVRLTAYRQGHILMPAALGEEQALHPLMVWWACLFVLSMLTRYEPDTWAQLINPDRSEWAIHIETFLGEALDIVPDLIQQQLRSGHILETITG